MSGQNIKKMKNVGKNVTNKRIKIKVRLRKKPEPKRKKRKR